MFDIYFDCETTGVNPYCDEIIEAYFAVYDNGKMIDEYLLESQVLFWSDEAALIHKIKYETMLSYPKKEIAFKKFLQWLPKNFRFITYVNKNTPLGVINFDVAILENELNLLGCPNYYLKNKYFMRQPLSIYDTVRDVVAKGGFTPDKNPETNRPMLGQTAVYKALFNKKYRSHRAKDDVKALVKIHQELLKLSDENRDLFR